MNRIIVNMIAILISFPAIAEETVLSEISESCFQKAYEDFNKEYSVKYGQFNAVVTDGVGFGKYKSFNLELLEPEKGLVSYDGRTLVVSPSNSILEQLVCKVAKYCEMAANKAMNFAHSKACAGQPKLHFVRQLLNR